MKTCLTLGPSSGSARVALPTLGALCIALLLMLGSAPVRAGALADLEIVDTSSGTVLPVYRHDGRLYVAGTPGARYAVRVANRSASRLLAVVAVDGVNVLSGETAAPAQSGYVFSAHERYDISGWRKSTTQTAAFYFTELPDSYAARTARGDQVGVIGIAVFREWTPPRPLAESESDAPGSARDEAGAQRAAPAAPKSPSALAERERLGTGHGERLHSVVTHTEFRRASMQPDEVIAIHYDRRDALIARGIVPLPTRGLLAEPVPFPGGFVPDPGA